MAIAEALAAIEAGRVDIAQQRLATVLLLLPAPDLL
jgi:hypothetical protein